MHGEKASSALGRQWMIFSKDLNPQEIRMKLLQDSWNTFKVLEFGDWVDRALGNYSTAVAILEAHHEHLAFSLFDFLCCFPLEAGKYWSLLENLNSEGFVYQAVLHALEAFKSGSPYSDIQLNTYFITKPIQALLSQPDAHILSKLKALEARYMRYKTGPGMIEGRYFDTGTALLNLLISYTPKSMAIKLSRNALKLFRTLSLEGILTQDPNLRLLGNQWNQVCLDAKDLAVADIQQGKMRAVAQVFLRLTSIFYPSVTNEQ
ncbi:uncharacterized protein N7482_007982 [Penicillium canariense]|uniref:Uncharacterized protein n=1 Tax=Penicillium canariense TaxID=189055 RepID=A0A9W9I043_9EURO|nr:uncharacterized protein N7482_007982 [Penicillium canariense]KAJ5160978.1 hypothetical protein N7482_007982 [Penicillium canariense]